MTIKIKNIGILGSGQLGRMLIIAATQLGFRTHVFAPDAKNSPAGEIAHEITEANYDDDDALSHFGSQIDVVTSEFENVPARAMNILSNHCHVSPGEKALHVAQDRMREKNLAKSLGIQTPRFWHIRKQEDLVVAMKEMRGKGVLKTCQFGYDGKGQMMIDADANPEFVFKKFDNDNLILEEYVEFKSEVSFLIARNLNGGKSLFPPTVNEHKNGILSLSRGPAILPNSVINIGKDAVVKLADKLEVVGLLALETFVTKRDEILFNEIAPRPHNSFHWTIEGCTSSQFTQLVRAITQMPFGSTSCYGQWEMSNILGKEINFFDKLANQPGTHLHLYGKSDPRPLRKMGHTNRQIKST